MARRLEATLVCVEEGISEGYTICISDKGDVYSCGFSSYGAHGFPARQVVAPQQITSLKNIIGISCGKRHTACLDTNGNLFTFGSNLNGQLGIGMPSAELTYTEIPQKCDLSSIRQISCGNYFTVCLTDNEELYSFGANLQGQLGLGKNEGFFHAPQLIESLNDVEFVECGGEFVFCKTFDNQVFCWGRNYSGQLGLGNTDNQNLPIQCSSLLNIDTVDIKCGDSHSLVLTVNQKVLSCGYNVHMQLGQLFTENEKYYTFQIINELSNIIRIECGENHSTCIDGNHDLYFFGDNSCGQLGSEYYYPEAELFKHPSLSNILDVSKGGSHTFIKVLSESNEQEDVYSFGYNESQQLAYQSNEEYSFSPSHPHSIFKDNWVSHIVKSNCKSAKSIRQ